MESFAIELDRDEWTLVVTGSDEECGIQISSAGECAVAIADAEPAADSDDYFILSQSGDKSMVLSVPDGASIFARSLTDTHRVKLRGYRSTP